MQLAFFGVNLLLVMLVWQLMLRKSILDHSRDKLFDLRDEVRDVFIAKNWDLNSTVYRNLRDLLNGHLRFTEEFSIWRVIYMESAVKEGSDLDLELQKAVSKRFKAANAEQAEFVNKIRRQSVVAVMQFAIYGSGFLLLLALLTAPVLALVKALSVVNKGVGAAIEVCAFLTRDVGRSVSILMTKTTEAISKRLFITSVFETYSFRLGPVVRAY